MILSKFDDFYNIWTIYTPEPPIVLSFRTHNLIFPGSGNNITPKFFTIISKGLRNKFGPEWIPGELEISFNYFNVILENKKTIRYLLSENETIKIADQIYNLIIDSKKNNDESYLWRKSDSPFLSFKSGLPE